MPTRVALLATTIPAFPQRRQLHYIKGQTVEQISAEFSRLRVNGNELRVKVVAEGGNLGAPGGPHAPLPLPRQRQHAGIAADVPITPA